MCKHAANRIVAVGTAEGDAAARSHVAGAEVVVVRAAHTSHREVVGLEGKCVFHATGLLVQTAHERIAELAALHVVHLGAVDVDFVVLLVEGTVAETYWAEQISHL